MRRLTRLEEILNAEARSVDKPRKKKPIPAGFVSFTEDILGSLPSGGEQPEASDNGLRSGKKTKNKEAIM
jgi:hypothetical protein